MFEIVVGALLIILTALLAEEASAKWKKWLWGLFIALVLAQAGIQIRARIIESRKADASDKAQAALKSELDQSLLTQQYTKGQLDSISLMVGRLGQPSPQSSELSAAIKQMAQASAQNVSDLKASNADLCKRAHEEAEQIRVFQEQYDASERSMWEQNVRRQIQAKTDQERNQLFTEETTTEMNARQGHEAEFRNKYMSEAKYLRDLLMNRIPPNAAGVIRNTNSQADTNLTTSMLAGAFNEYSIASYLDALANALCPQPEQEKKSKQAMYHAVANHLHQLGVEGEKLHQRCWPNSTNPPSNAEVAAWVNKTNNYVHRSAIEESLKTQFAREGFGSNGNYINVAPGCAAIMGKILDKSASITILERDLSAR